MKCLRRRGGFAASVRVTCGTCLCEQSANCCRLIFSKLPGLEVLRKNAAWEPAHFLTCLFKILPRVGKLRTIRVFEHDSTNHAARERFSCSTCLSECSPRARQLIVSVVCRPDERCVVRACVCFSKQTRPLIEGYSLGFVFRIPFSGVGNPQARPGAPSTALHTALPVVKGTRRNTRCALKSSDRIRDASLSWRSRHCPVWHSADTFKHEPHRGH